MKFVSYLRVSTADQNLGIEAQRAKVAAYAASAHGEIIAEYEEHESGKNDARPQLAAVLAKCEETGATLLIAKLDRLSRRVEFLFRLKERMTATGLKAVAIDAPQALDNTLLLSVMAGLAQQERELISERTKAALAVKKAQGVKLGRPVGTDTSVARAASIASKKAGADAFATSVCPVIKSLRDAGTPLLKIADTLNAQGILTRRGSQWTATAVKRVLERC